MSRFLVAPNVFKFDADTNPFSLVPDPNITRVFFGKCCFTGIGGLEYNFPNMRMLFFGANCNLASFASIFPVSIEWFFFRSNETIDFSRSVFPSNSNFSFTISSPCNFGSLMTIIPRIPGSHIDIHLIDMDQPYYEHLALVIVTHRGTGSFTAIGPPPHFRESMPRLVAMVNQNFTFNFVRATEEDILSGSPQPIQKIIITLLTARCIPRIASSSAIKKLPAEVVRLLTSFFN